MSKMSLEDIVARAREKTEYLTQLRADREAIVHENPRVFRAIETIDSQISQSMRELEALANKAEKAMPGDVSKIDIGSRFSLQRVARRQLALPTIWKHVSDLMKLDVVKLPSANKIRKLVTDGKLPPIVLKCLPKEDEKEFDVQVRTPRGW
jgi:hypothetical protein